MKAINFKLATFSFAALLLASCSDSGMDTPVSPVSPAMNSKLQGLSATATTDAATLAARVINYKGAYNNTETASAKVRSVASRAITRAEKSMSRPADAKDLKEVLNDNPWNAHPGVYYIAKGETIKGKLESSNLNITGMTIYVEGTFDYSEAYGSNATINVLEGGKLIARNDKEIFSDTKISNEGTIEYPTGQSTYTIKNEFYNFSGDVDLGDASLDFQGSKDTRMYVSGNLKAKNISINGSQLVTMGDATTEKFYMTGNGSYASIQGSLTTTNQGEDLDNNYSLKLDNSAKLEVGCAIKSSGVVYITNSASIQTLYLQATNYQQDSNAKLILKNQSMVNIAGYYKNLNNGQGTADLSEAGVAVIKAGAFYYNAPGPNTSEDGAKTVDCSIFATSGDNAHIIIDAQAIYGSENASAPITADGTTVVWNKDANVHWYGDADAKDFVIKKTECNPSGYNDNNSKPSPDPDPDPEPNNKPSLDLITSIDYEGHDHDISATCIKEYNNKMYMSYHTRGNDHGACIEVFTPVQNNAVTMQQYLQDTDNYLDFNHLIVDGRTSTPRVLTVGSHFKKGAMTATIDLAGDGLLNTEAKQITEDEETKTVQPIQMIQLVSATAENAKKGYDENCIVRDGDNYVVATTKGYTVYDAETLNEVKNTDTQGRVKHICLNDGKIVSLTFDRQVDTSAGDDEYTAIPAHINIFPAGTTDFSSPEKSFAVEAITPNNGKNTIAYVGGRIYACLGGAGLYCYDTNGQEIWHYQMKKAIIENGDKAGQYKACANGVYVGSKYIYVAYGSAGLKVLDMDGNLVAERYKEVKAGNYSANYVKVYNGYIYVAHGKSRLQVYKLYNVDADTDVSYDN